MDVGQLALAVIRRGVRTYRTEHLNKHHKLKEDEPDGDFFQFQKTLPS